ncbi:MAG TPA: LLM class flavin-dependent oxidoreductase [Chloroflexota bacterium]|nr:LLM class flavin-dependent oxidoreductase [Chloroflexota bacterium]
MPAQASRADRVAMYGRNKLKLGFFGPNCSSGRFVTKAPERWSGSWDDNVRLAQMADEAGIDFLLPIARWKGYGGDTDYQGATWETITWATGLLALTKRITIFGTVHAALFPPLIAAKQMVTADHVGHGRFGLNLVCGWNEGEFEMFGVKPGDHDRRYRLGQEWLDVLRLIWAKDDFDFTGEFFDLKGVREKPKPYGGTFPLTMNAGASGDGRTFALRNCDAWFTNVLLPNFLAASLDEAAKVVLAAKADARAMGNAIGAYTVGVIVCRPTRQEAEDYYHYVADEQADWAAVDRILEMRGRTNVPPDELQAVRRHQANGMGGIPFIGSPDDVAGYLAQLSRAGFDGCGLSFVNYADEFPYFRDEVLPRLERLGLRESQKEALKGAA